MGDEKSYTFYYQVSMAKLTRSENMSRIKSKNTSIEIALRQALWAKGLRYRLNVKSVLGKPDIVFKSKKIAIFCDSEFWHGKDYVEGRYPIKTNKEFWNNKLEQNIERDKFVNKTLNEQGWTVLRFWAQDIETYPDIIVDKILSILNEK